MDDIRSLVTRFYDTWNARDRDGWLACCAEDVTFNGPGGIAGRGSTPAVFWSLWQDAFPDNVPQSTSPSQKGTRPSRNRSSQARTRGHSMCPTVDIPPTGKRVEIPYTLGLTYRDGKWLSFRLIFDRAELMTQLGLMPA